MENQIQITEKIAKTVLHVVDQGLCSGVGTPDDDGNGIPGQMCVEAAVCYAMGLPHGDKPPCVAPLLRSLKIRLNDASWSSELARAKGLRRLAVAQLGSAGVLDEKDFAQRVVLLAVKTVVPAALRAAASVHPEQAHKAALEKAAIDCEKVEDNAADAADAADAAAYAADAAAYAYAARADADAASAARDKLLSDFAEGVVQILITMDAPGCQWLVLTE